MAIPPTIHYRAIVNGLGTNQNEQFAIENGNILVTAAITRYQVQ